MATALRAPHRSSRPERVAVLLEEFRMSHVADLYASELSYGQRKLLEFAAVLMSTPRLVLLDEPTAGVNPVMMATMEHHIRERHARVSPSSSSSTTCLRDAAVRPGRRARSAGHQIFAGPPDAGATDPLVLDAYLGADRGRRCSSCDGVVAGYGAGDILKGVDLEVAGGTVHVPDRSATARASRRSSRPSAGCSARGPAP